MHVVRCRGDAGRSASKSRQRSRKMTSMLQMCRFEEEAEEVYPCGDDTKSSGERRYSGGSRWHITRKPWALVGLQSGVA
jgi:hypothetical protein